MDTHRLFLSTLSLLSSALLALSCGSEPAPGAGDVMCRVVFRLESMTKAPDVSDYGVDHVDLLAFRDGSRVAYAHVDGQSPVTVTLRDGETVDWHVVVNGPSGALAGYGTEEDLLSGLSLLSDGAASGLLVMYGSGSFAPVDGLDVQVTVRRYACKVSFGNVCFEYYDNFSTAPVVTLERVALVNVRGSVPYSGVPTGAAGDLWYNRMGLEEGLPSGVGAMLVRELGSRRVESSGPVSCGESLYCMPNPVSNNVTSATAPTWSPRSTRVALQVRIDGEDHWYPVTLPAMEPNKVYVIENLIIMGPGSSGPDIPVTRDDVSFNVRVRDWVTGDPVDVSFDD